VIQNFGQKFLSQKKVNDFEFSLAKDLRFDEKMTHLNEVFSEVGVQYKMVKGIYA